MMRLLSAKKTLAGGRFFLNLEYSDEQISNRNTEHTIVAHAKKTESFSPLPNREIGNTNKWTKITMTPYLKKKNSK